MQRRSSKRRLRHLAWWAAAVVALGGLVGASTLDGGDRGDGADGAALTEVPDHDPAGPSSSESGGTTAGGQSVGGVAPSGDDGTSSDGADAGGGSEAAGSGAGEGASVSGGEGSRSDPAALRGEPVASLDGSQVVRTATLELGVEAGALDDAHRRARERVAEVGGFVASSTFSGGSGELTLRVPAERFDVVLDDLRGLGEVTSEAVSGEDVSRELVDLEARLRHWRAQEAAFLELMAEASSIEQTIEIRRELSTIQETIEQIEGRRRFLENQVRLSTITLRLSEPDGAVVPEPETGPEQGTLAEAWDRAWDAALTIVGGTIVLLGVLLPLVLIVGVPALLAWALVRRRSGTGARATSSPPASA